MSERSTDLATWIEDGAVVAHLRVHGLITWFADGTDRALVYSLDPHEGDARVTVKHFAFEDAVGHGKLPGEEPTDADLRRAMKEATRSLVDAGRRHLADFNRGQSWLETIAVRI